MKRGVFAGMMRRMASKDVARSVKAADVILKSRQQAIRAHQLRISGMSWVRVAEELGISVGKAQASVAEIVSTVSDVVDEGMRAYFLSMEVSRLDALQAAIWRDALSGDLQAIDRSLKIISERSKLLGLHIPANAPVTNNTIVVQGGTDEYVAALRQASRMAVEASNDDDQ